jgi:hypothetical protein
VKTAEINTNKEMPKFEVISSTRKSLTKPITESTVKKNTIITNITRNNALLI